MRKVTPIIKPVLVGYNEQSSASELPLLKFSEISAKSLLQRVLFLSVFRRAYKLNIQIPKVLYLKMIIQWEKHTASAPIYGKSEKF